MTINAIPPGSRVERKKEETRRKIVAAALKLFREQGFEATTMEQIAAEADIAKGTLYNYFPVKEAVLDDYVNRTLAEKNAERLQRLPQLPGTRARLVMALSELMEGVQAQSVLFERYLTFRIQRMVSLRRDESANSGFYPLASAIITLGQAGGEIRTDLPFDILVDLMEFAFIETAQRFYRQPETFEPGTVIEECVELFMNGCAQPHSIRKEN